MESPTPSRKRNRWYLLSLAALVLSLGYLTRRHSFSLPHFIGSYAPDTLWALLVFIVVLLLAPWLSTRCAFTIALLFSYSIECSQLYQAPWLNAIRDTTVGGLLLGHGFLWSDLICYTIGVTFGALIDSRFAPRSNEQSQTKRPAT